VDDEKDFDELENEWNKTTTADLDTENWFGIIKASGEKEKLLTILSKLAKNGCSVEIDPSHKIDIPAPNKWWAPEYFPILEKVKFKKKDMERIKN
jgi:hypothetical protein